MEDLSDALRAGRWEDLTIWARAHLIEAAPRLLAGRVSREDGEELVQGFMAELWVRRATFWPNAIGAHRTRTAVQAYLSRAFSRFALRRLAVAPDEADVFQRRTCRLLADAPEGRFSRFELPGGRAYGLQGWARRALFDRPWWPILQRHATEFAPYLRRRAYGGSWTWHSDDILDGCERLLGLCARMCRALHLARGLIASGWFHIVDLFSPMPAEAIERATQPASSADGVLEATHAFVDQLSERRRDALWHLVNRYEEVPITRWTARALSARWGTSEQTVYNERARVERALRRFLDGLEPTGRVVAISVLGARFDALDVRVEHPPIGSEPSEESSGAAA